MQIEITAGSGQGQVRTITAYIGNSKQATVDQAWDKKQQPDQTSVYRLVRAEPPIQLTVPNLTRLYRFSQMVALLKLSVAETLGLLALIDVAKVWTHPNGLFLWHLDSDQIILVELRNGDETVDQ